MFLKCADKKGPAATSLIEKVRFGLHPSFGVDHVDIKTTNENDEYAMTFKGWGSFEIPTTIYFRRTTGLNPRNMEFTHMLHLDGAGKWKTVSVFIPKANAKKLGFKV